jgi:hypothetical protein
MANRSTQNRRRITLNYDGFKCQVGYLDLAEDLAERQKAWFGKRSDTIEFAQFNPLVHLGIASGVAGIACGRDTQEKKKVRSATKSGYNKSALARWRVSCRIHCSPTPDCDVDPLPVRAKYPARVRTRSRPRPGASTFTAIFLNELPLISFAGAYPNVYCSRRSRAIVPAISEILWPDRGKNAIPPVSLQSLSSALGFSSSVLPTRPIE